MSPKQIPGGMGQHRRTSTGRYRRYSVATKAPIRVPYRTRTISGTHYIKDKEKTAGLCDANAVTEILWSTLVASRATSGPRLRQVGSIFMEQERDSSGMKSSLEIFRTFLARHNHACFRHSQRRRTGKGPAGTDCPCLTRVPPLHVRVATKYHTKSQVMSMRRMLEDTYPPPKSAFQSPFTRQYRLQVHLYNPFGYDMGEVEGKGDGRLFGFDNSMEL
ncbi:hypothetical protein DFH27DRAFT_617122 [Peziza echinospora]|nr:hypothetical protein DFH27DRAFT_617122 [Peziza echinospora]